MKIGFVGAGRIGQGVARLSREAGHDVALSNSRGPDSLQELAQTLDAEASSVADAVRDADIVVVTVPFTQVFVIDPEPFAGKLILDTNNYYPTRDGHIAELDSNATTTSLMVQRHFSESTVVKAFNAILAGDLEAPFGLPDAKRALPIAGDNEAAVEVAERFHRGIGFDVVAAGSLAKSWRFERAKPAYCIPLDHEGLVSALNKAEREVEVPHNSWHRT
jgi:hypothetical protein